MTGPADVAAGRRPAASTSAATPAAPRAAGRARDELAANAPATTPRPPANTGRAASRTGHGGRRSSPSASGTRRAVAAAAPVTSPAGQRVTRSSPPRQPSPIDRGGSGIGAFAVDQALGRNARRTATARAARRRSWSRRSSPGRGDGRGRRRPGQRQPDDHGVDVVRVEVGIDDPRFLRGPYRGRLGCDLGGGRGQQVAGRHPFQPGPHGEPDDLRSVEVGVVQAHRVARQVVGVERDQVHDELQVLDEHRVEQAVLRRVPGVDLRLVRAGGGGDPVHPGSGDAVRENSAAAASSRRRRVALPSLGTTEGYQLFSCEPVEARLRS